MGGLSLILGNDAGSGQVEAVVAGLELPSANGAMRTRTYYTLRLADGSSRQTTIDRLAPVPG